MKSGLEVKNGNANLTRYLTRISRRFFKKSHKLLILNGTPYRIRTCDLRLRRPLLYPTELRAPRGEIDVSIYADNGCELYFQHSESQRFFHKIKLDG